MSIGSLFRNLLKRRRAERELDDELRAYVDQLTSEQMAAGVGPSEARRRALLQLGGMEQVKEEVRARRPGALLEQFVQDLRYGARQMRRAPSFTAVAVLTLGLGMGVSAAIFSVVDTVLLRPLPYREPDRLVAVYEGDVGRSVLAWTEYLAFVEQTRTLESVSAIQPVSATVLNVALPEQVSGALVSASTFPMLGIQPLAGRGFLADEDRPGAGQVALISESLWRRAYGGDSAIVGKPITLEVNESWGRPVNRSQSYTVVGVLPASFQTLLPGTRGDVWLPLAAERNDSHDLFVLGRLKPGVSAADARTDLETIAAPMRTAVHSDGRPMRFAVVSVLDDLLGSWRRALLVLLGAVGFVLLIACVNVANLILARGWARSRELSVRAGLGASRGRIRRQLLTETMLLAVLGGVVAVVVAQLGITLLTRLAPADLARLDQAQLDPRVVVFMAGLVVLAMVLSGLLPAMRLSGFSPQRGLQEAGRGLAESRGSRRLRSGLVVVEVALAIVLLIGSGLMVRTITGLIRVDPGFSTRNVLTFRLSLPRQSYQTKELRTDFYEGLFTKLDALPGVQAVGISHAVPFGGLASGTMVTADGSTESVNVRWQAVSPDYFRALTIPIVRGDPFARADMRGEMQRVVVDRLAAERLWGDRNPLGQRLRMSGNPAALTVIGIAGTTREASLDQPGHPTIYLPVFPGRGSVVMLAEGDTSALVPAIRRALLEVDSIVAPSDFLPMAERVARSFGLQRFTALLLGVFATAAAFLGIVGLYGVIAFAVGRRTREIGIRRALGAERLEIVGLVVAQGARLVAAGIALGLAGAFGLTRLLSTMLFDVRAADVATYAIVSVVMTAVALLACLVPARRAARVDPVTALRQD
ncbi:MAG TPA: ABC transporter permease [Vicinamibacterales bacterium]|nr:ABC transporter permease [Vicinamibacterales bacterium]